MLSTIRLVLLTASAFYGVAAQVTDADPAQLSTITGVLNCAEDVLAPSKVYPSDFNKVRPADIMFIAALGDSITTAQHAINVANLTYGPADKSPYEGNSFDMGGNGTMSTHLTLPNIMKTLNPALRGQSYGQGIDPSLSQLNVAIPGRKSDDFPRQAQDLVNRTKLFYTADELNHGWKLINMFIGTNDIGLLCNDSVGIITHTYKDYVKEAIMIIQDNIPRTIISLIGMTNFDFDIFAKNIIFNTPNLYYCGNGSTLAQPRILEYRQAMWELSVDPELQKKDSVIVVQRLFDDLTEPLKKKDGSYYSDFYAFDVFHFSRLGHSLVAKQLWKQLLQPYGKKSTTNDDLADGSSELACPDPKCPYIRTPLNSFVCLA